jgi:hypothetical protein
MRSKNHKPLTADEREHIAWVKSQPCAVCGASPPVDAHHIEQELHFLCLPLCHDCHQGSSNGIHGRKAMWKVMRKTEQTCLNELIARLRKAA